MEQLLNAIGYLHDNWILHRYFILICLLMISFNVLSTLKFLKIQVRVINFISSIVQFGFVSSNHQKLFTLFQRSQNVKLTSQPQRYFKSWRFRTCQRIRIASEALHIGCRYPLVNVTNETLKQFTQWYLCIIQGSIYYIFRFWGAFNGEIIMVSCSEASVLKQNWYC